MNKFRPQEIEKNQWDQPFLNKIDNHKDFNKSKMAPFKKLLYLCDSQPEILLLQDLIEALSLSYPYNKNSIRGMNKGLLTSPNNEIKIQCQIEISTYRVDFLINRKLVVEIDGRSFHDNDHSFYGDRIRDQHLMEKGYLVVRFPASQVYRKRPHVIARILNIMRQHGLVSSHGSFFL